MSEQPSFAMMAAMQNKLILAKIAPNLPPCLLMRLRQTCKSWNDALVPIVCNSAVNILRPWDKNPTTPSPLNTRLMRAMEGYTECMRHSLAVPYSQYSPPQPNPANWTQLEDFWSICGNSVQGLYFRVKLHSIEIEAETELVRRTLFGRTPNLVRLELLFVLGPGQVNQYHQSLLPSMPSGASPADCIIHRVDLPNMKHLILEPISSFIKFQPWCALLKDICCNAINLDTLTLYDTADALCVGPLLNLAGIHLHKLKNLTTTSIQGPDLEALIRVATRKDNPLQLENFTTRVSFPNIKATEQFRFRSLLHQFLVTQSTALRRLDLRTNPVFVRQPQTAFIFGDEPNDYAATEAIRLPRMGALRRLDLWVGVFDNIPVRLGGGSIAQTLPMLIHFACEFEHLQSDLAAAAAVEAEQIQLRHDGVRRLALTFNMSTENLNLDLDLVPMLAKIFPSITHLELVLVNTFEPLRWFFNLWPMMTSFRVKWEHIGPPEPHSLDAVLSGADVSRLDELKRELDQIAGRVTLGALHSLLPNYKTYPGLSDLRNLQEFVLNVGSAFTITDVGGYLGFAVASPHLQRVAIMEGGACEFEFKNHAANKGNLISAECRQLMQSAIYTHAEILL